MRARYIVPARDLHLKSDGGAAALLRRSYVGRQSRRHECRRSIHLYSRSSIPLFPDAGPYGVQRKTVSDPGAGSASVIASGDEANNDIGGRGRDGYHPGAYEALTPHRLPAALRPSRIISALQSKRDRALNASAAGPPARTSNPFSASAPSPNMTADECERRRLRFEFEHWLEANLSQARRSRRRPRSLHGGRNRAEHASRLPGRQNRARHDAGDSSLF